MSLFQCLVSLYPNRDLPPPSVFQKEKEGRGSPEPQELSFCTVIGSLFQDSSRAESRGLWVPLKPGN